MVTKDNDFLVTWLMYPKFMVDMSDGGWKMGKVDIGLRFPEGQLESGRFDHRFRRFVAVLMVNFRRTV